MGLMNLLTAGSSLSEARERPHRYKLRSGALPKFGNRDVPTDVKKSSVAFAGSERAKSAVESQPMNFNTITVQKAPGLPALGELARKINVFKAGPPATVHPVVQGELSLDRVKPVRNDLSDSDLELVRVTKKPEAAPSSVKIGSVDVPIVKAVPFLQRVRGLFQRVR